MWTVTGDNLANVIIDHCDWFPSFETKYYGIRRPLPIIVVRSDIMLALYFRMNLSANHLSYKIKHG